jgi:two-component system chemotaxis sensor kinase CheA
VINFGGQCLGLVVDRIIGRQGVVAKPLSHHLGQISEISGAALLGDGAIVFVLNPLGLKVWEKNGISQTS